MTRFTVVCISFIVVSLMFVGIGNAKIDPKSIVGMWLFDEGKGKVAEDSSGNDNAGKIMGAKWVKGKVGNALSFDGKDNYVLVDIGGSVPQSITLAAWIYPIVGGVVLSEVGQGVINSGWHDSQMEVLVSGEIKVGFWTGAEQGISLGKFSFNKWYNVAMTYDKGGSSIKGYVNGELKESGKLVKQYPGDLWYGIGAADTTNLGSGAYFNGIIDEVALFNVALSEADIQANMKRGTAVYPTGKLTTTWVEIKK